MHFSTLILTSIVSVAYASDMLQVWCQNQEKTVCLDTISQPACYDCLHPIEAGCPGDNDSAEFLSCFCRPDGPGFASISKCYNDDSKCAGKVYAMNAWYTQCFKYNKDIQDAVCPAPKDKFQKLVADWKCGGYTGKPSPPSTTSATTTAKPSTSTTVPTSAPVKSATSTPTLNTTVPCPTATNNITIPTVTPPVVVGGATGLAVTSSIMALIAAAAVLNGF